MLTQKQFEIIAVGALIAMACGLAVIMRDAANIEAVATGAAELSIARENDEFCERVGLRRGSHEHLICTMDLNRIRAEQSKRIALQPKLP
jgi:hypothetical protein